MRTKNSATLRDKLYYARIRLTNQWIHCPSCNDGRMLFDKPSRMWECEDCGYSLPEEDMVGAVFWHCCGCGAFLNIQEGYEPGAISFVCTECGSENDLSESNIKGECRYCGKELDNPRKTICNDCDIERLEKLSETLLGIGNIFKAASEERRQSKERFAQEREAQPVDDLYYQYEYCEIEPTDCPDEEDDEEEYLKSLKQKDEYHFSIPFEYIKKSYGNDEYDFAKTNMEVDIKWNDDELGYEAFYYAPEAHIIDPSESNSDIEEFYDLAVEPILLDQLDDMGIPCQALVGGTGNGRPSR